jgi:predicted DNA-binding transcriptional regulator AlpA
MPNRSIRRNDPQTLVALRQFDDLPASAYVKLPVVQILFGGVSGEEIRRRVLDGRIPKPTKLGSRNNIWQVGELREALARLQQPPERR